MNCNGMHCPGCGHGGGAAGGAGAVIALLVIIALALRKAWPAIISAVEITAWTVAGLAGAVLVTTGGVLAVRRGPAGRGRAPRPGGDPGHAAVPSAAARRPAHAQAVPPRGWPGLAAAGLAVRDPPADRR